jgi:hypothetical protein
MTWVRDAAVYGGEVALKYDRRFKKPVQKLSTSKSE